MVISPHLDPLVQDFGKEIIWHHLPSQHVRSGGEVLTEVGERCGKLEYKNKNT